MKEIFEKKKKEYVKGLTDRGNQLFLEKKYEECKKIFNKIILVDPDNLQAKDKIEVCDEQLKILERKREVYHNPSLDIKTIEKWDSEHIKEISVRAIELINKKKFKAALELLKECKEKDPNNFYFEDKIKLVELFIKIQKKSDDFTLKITVNTGNSECQKLLKQLENLDSDFKIRRNVLEEANFLNHMIAIAKYYLHNNRHDEAEMHLKQAVEMTGASDKVLILLAEIYYRRVDYVQSYQAYKTLKYKEGLSYELRPVVRYYYYELVFRLYKLLIIVILIQLSVISFIIYRSYAIVDYAFDGIITRFFTFTMHDSKYYYERGVVQYNRSNYDRAVSELSKAVSLDKSNVMAHLNLGMAYYKKKDYPRARLSLEAALRMMPDNQRAAYYLALIYDYMKMQKEAVVMLEIARGITVTNRNFTMLEIEKNRRLYIGVFQDYKLSADKILNLNEPALG